MYFTAKLTMYPFPFNMIFNKIIFIFVYFRTGEEGLIEQYLLLLETKKWNQELSGPTQHLVCDGPCNRVPRNQVPRNQVSRTT